MTPREHDREALRRALAEAIGQEAANLLMEHLPPFPWDEIARQDDLVALRSDVDELKTGVAIINETLDLRFDSLRDGLSAQFHADLLAHARMMFFSMLGAVFTAASLAFAAVRL